MRKRNIYKMANSNSSYLKAQYDLLRQRYETQGNSPILDSFIAFIKNGWSVSINMDLLAIHGFLVSGGYRNVYGFIDDSVNAFNARSRLDRDRALKGLLKNWVYV